MRPSFISIIIAILISLFFGLALSAQQGTRRLTLSLDEVLRIAKKQSPDAILAQHRFRGSYWQYRTYRAEFLPGLTLNATLPDFNRSISSITLPDGSDRFIERNTINSIASASLTQNVGLTGGQIFLNSELQRIDNLDRDSASYRTTPVSIGFRQPLNGFNSYRWQRKIEPLRFEEARRNYMEALENVSVRAVNLFFELALAQVNLEIAKINYNNTDTLYRISQGRYNIGTIAENQLLQMELSFLNAGISMNEALIALEVQKFQLRSFLGYNETVDLELVFDTNVPDFRLDVAKVSELALQNNPQILNFDRQLIEAEREVARAKSQRGLSANLFANYGLTQSAPELAEAYVDPQISQRVTVGVEIPILDWGLGKGRYRLAQSSQEVIRTQVEQSRVDFEQNVFIQVMQFNLQNDQLNIAAKADTIAQLRFDVTRERFLIGKIDVLDLNIALTEKDVAKRNYISTLRNYWRYYFNLRRLTLYDLEKDQPLWEDFDALVN
jgi:outer membrane protein TolC